jgi:hypothetical protein
LSIAYIDGTSGAPRSFAHVNTAAFCARENLRRGELKRRWVKNSYRTVSENHDGRLGEPTGLELQGYNGSSGETSVATLDLEGREARLLTAIRQLIGLREERESERKKEKTQTFDVYAMVLEIGSNEIQLVTVLGLKS